MRIATVLLILMSEFVSGSESMNQIRTYMAFSQPVDPAHLVVLPDMDLSYGLASTLVTWDQHKQIKGALAERWENQDQKVARLHLSPKAKWSDGSTLLSTEVKASLERGLKVHAQEHRSLAKLVDRITCPDAKTLDFHLTEGSKDIDLLKKLTEPNFGIVSIGKNDALNLKRSSGAFFLEKESANELILKRSLHWYLAVSNMAEEIIIRRPPAKFDPASVLIRDAWPNLAESTSLMPEEIFKEYQAKDFSIWKRPMDRIFLMELSRKNATPDGAALLQFLHHQINRDGLVEGLAGHLKALQLMPAGYALHDTHFQCPKSVPGLPAAFKNKPLRISYFESRVSPVLLENLRKEILHVTGSNPVMTGVSLADFEAHHQRSEYDVNIGPAGVADPDPEGLLSYYVEGETPVIAPKPVDFLARLDLARKESDAGKKIIAMRKIMTDAVCAGQVLPLFHHSTLAIARDGIDLSQIPTSDESATLSKIRFRGAK